METNWNKHLFDTINITALEDDDDTISLALMERLKARIQRRAGKTRYRTPSERTYGGQNTDAPLTPAA